MVPHIETLKRLRAKGRPRGFATLLVVLGSVTAISTARGEVSSWPWRASLARSGLSGPKPTSLHASATTVPQGSYTHPPTNVPEPKPTTEYLSDLTQRRTAKPVQFDRTHPALGPLLGEEARLKAGNFTNVKTFNGLLPNTPFYNHERWVRSLNPTAFDKTHGNLGAMLSEDQRVRQLIATAPKTKTLSLHALGTGSVAAQEIQKDPTNASGGTNSAVPEPGSLALVLLGTGVLLARRFSGWLRQTTS